jgi:hypothetical protein
MITITLKNREIVSHRRDSAREVGRRVDVTLARSQHDQGHTIASNVPSRTPGSSASGEAAWRAPRSDAPGSSGSSGSSSHAGHARGPSESTAGKGAAVASWSESAPAGATYATFVRALWRLGAIERVEPIGADAHVERTSAAHVERAHEGRDRVGIAENRVDRHGASHASELEGHERLERDRDHRRRDLLVARCEDLRRQ